jgi:hypothetical protein
MHSALHDLRITKERISMELLNWPKTTGFSRETVLQPTIKDSLYHGIWASEEFVYSRITLIDSSPSFRHVVALYDKNLSFGLSTYHKKCLVVGRLLLSQDERGLKSAKDLAVHFSTPTIYRMEATDHLAFERQTKKLDDVIGSPPALQTMLPHYNYSIELGWT